MPDNIDSLEALSGQYAPLASGIPFQPDFGFQGTPLDKYPIAGMFAQPMIASMMSRVGMSPMGFSDRNMFDTMQSQRFFRMQMDMQRQMAQMDRESWINSMRGIARLTGTPWGADQIRASGNIANLAAAASPILNQLAPDIMDELSGYRGSASVMGGRMLMASRYRFDPVTGQYGQNIDQVKEEATRLFRTQFSGDNFGAMQGFTAGQYGQLEETMGRYGLVGSAAGMSSAEKLGSMGLRDAGKMSAAEQDRLLSLPENAANLRSLDSGQIKKSLEGYLGAVNAVRDIFGDAGKPNAPMAELIGALQALTNGSLGQLQPGDLSMMVRTTQQMAQATGIGMNGMMALQQQASVRASQMGLEPSFAVLAAQGGAAFGAAYRAQGLPPAWGRMNADQITQLDTNLRINAAGSEAAQRAGLAIRVSDALGGFKEGSAAAAYVAALKSSPETGATTWYDPIAKTNREMNLDDQQFSQLMTGTGQITLPDLTEMRMQKPATREYIEKYNLGDPMRRSQLRTDIIPWMSGQMQNFLAQQLASKGMTQEQANVTAARMSPDVAEKIMAISNTTFSSRDTRDKAISDILQGELQRKNADGSEYIPGGNAFLNRLGGDRDSEMQLTGDSLVGHLDTAIANDRNLRYLNNTQNLHVAFSTQLTDQASRMQQANRFISEIKEEMAPLNRGSMLRRITGVLQGVPLSDTPDKSALQAISEIMGGVPTDELLHGKDNKGGLMKPLEAALKQEQEMEATAQKIAAETDPAKKLAMIHRFDEQRKDLHNNRQNAMDVFATYMPDDTLVDPQKTQLAQNFGPAVSAYGKELQDIQGITDPTERAAKFAEFFKSDRGVEYTRLVHDQMRASSDVAMEFLSAPANADKYGLAGIESAKRIQEANRRLQALAAMYTNGNVDELRAGRLPANISDDRRKTIMDAVSAAANNSDAGVRDLYQLQTGTKADQRAWAKDDATIKTTAQSLGVSEADVRNAAKLTKANLDDLAIATNTDATDKDRQDKFDALTAKGATGETKDQLIAAYKVYTGLRQQAADAMGYQNMTQDDEGRAFMEKWGVRVGNEEADKKKLQDLGTLFKSEAGEGLYVRLTAGQDYLASLAARTADGKKLTEESTQAAFVRQKYRDAKKAGGTTEQAFRKMYGLQDAKAYSDFEEVIKEQEVTGFDRFGTGEGQTGGISVDEAHSLIAKRLTTGDTSSSQPNWKELLENLEVTMKGILQIDGNTATLKDAKGTANNAKNTNNVPSK